MNRFQACQTLNVNSNSSFEDVKLAYRRLVLEVHPDKNSSIKDDKKFKEITEAYHFLKIHKTPQESISRQKWSSKSNFSQDKSKGSRGFWRDKKQSWVPPGGKTPEEDWSRFTKDFEDENPNFWKEYEKKFWEEYNSTINVNGEKAEFEKTKEPEQIPNLLVGVDHSLCIGCCSCEIIAPEVFQVDKLSKMNPKSNVINGRGAGKNKIMNAAETCPTKAISVKNKDTGEKLFPW